MPTTVPTSSFFSSSSARAAPSSSSANRRCLMPTARPRRPAEKPPVTKWRRHVRGQRRQRRPSARLPPPRPGRPRPGRPRPRGSPRPSPPPLPSLPRAPHPQLPLSAQAAPPALIYLPLLLRGGSPLAAAPSLEPLHWLAATKLAFLDWRESGGPSDMPGAPLSRHPIGSPRRRRGPINREA